MNFEQKVDELVKESFSFHGEVRQFMKNTSDYIGAVNANQKNHEKDPDAHPRAERERKTNILAVCMGAIAVLELGIHFFKK